jgi:hypothetical protein
VTTTPSTPTADRRPAGARGRAVAAAVLLCVAVATLGSLERFDQVIGLFDWRADRNSSQSYLELLYADEGVVGDRDVIEEARLRMPEDATYRVVVGQDLRAGNRFTPLVIAEYLEYFLLPRRQVGDASAEWALCYGCDPRTLGAGRVRMADGRNGVSFWRLPPRR